MQELESEILKEKLKRFTKILANSKKRQNMRFEYGENHNNKKRKYR